MKKNDFNLELGETHNKDLVSMNVYELIHLNISGDNKDIQSKYLNLFIKRLRYENTPARKILIIDDNDSFMNIKNVNYESIQKMIDEINGAIISRYSLMQESGVNNIQGYNTIKNKLELDYLFIIIPDLKELIELELITERISAGLKNIVKFGRMTGIHLIINSDTKSFLKLDREIRDNIETSVIFKTDNINNSIILLGHEGAELLEDNEAFLKYFGGTDKIRI